MFPVNLHTLQPVFTHSRPARARAKAGDDHLGRVQLKTIPIIERLRGFVCQRSVAGCCGANDFGVGAKGLTWRVVWAVILLAIVKP
jgi:hypothetical protein